nr:glycosyltransferase family 4 protein [Adlercreutzia sp. ZJ473]
MFSATLVRGHIAKFHIPYLKWFKEQGWETWVAARNDYPDGVCEIPYCDRFVNVDFARSPFSKQTFVAYGQLCELFSRERFDLVHAHTPVGGVLTRLAARDARRTGTRVVYTAHGFHFYDGAPLANWLLWYPVERLMSHFTDVLVTINREDHERAERFARCRVEYVPGVGVDLSRFAAAKPRGPKRSELGIGDDNFAILSVGDLIPRKNQRAIVEALPLLPGAVRLVVCGEGSERESLLEQARELGVSDRISLLGFRDDMAGIMAACDCLVFPSVHEGLPVSVMEAMASGLPVVASSIRGVDPDLLVDRENGLLLSEATPEAIASAVSELMGDPSLGPRLAEGALSSVRRFELGAAIRETALVYARVAS